MASNLTGTDKQISWALNIAAKVTAQAEIMRGQVASHPTATADQKAARNAELDAALAYLDTRTNAAWWIDRAYVPPTELLREALRSSKQ